MYKKRTNKIQILIYIFAFFSMLDLNSVYDRLTNQNFYITEISIALSLCLGAFSLFKLQGLKKRIIVFLITYYIYVLIFLIYSPKENIIDFVIKFCLCLPSLIILFNADLSNIKLYLKSYSNIVYFVAVISLIFYVFTVVIPLISPINSVMVSWRGNAAFKNYLYLYFSADYSYFDGFLRNTALFVEAPQFGIHLCMALLYELFIERNVNFRKIFVLVVAIISTISFGSIIVMLVLFFAKYLLVPIKSRYFQMIRKVFSILIFVLMFIMIWYLFETKMSTGNSFKIRMDDFVSGFDSWKLHPFFGNGYGNDDVIMQYVGEFRSWNLRNGIIGFSNSIAMLLSNGGIALFLIYAASAFMFLKSRLLDVYVRLLIIFTILLLLILNSFAYSVLIISFLAIGYAVGIDSMDNTNKIK